MKIMFQEWEQKGSECFWNVIEKSAPTSWAGIYSPWASPLNLLAFSVMYRGKHALPFFPLKKSTFNIIISFLS